MERTAQRIGSGKAREIALAVVLAALGAMAVISYNPLRTLTSVGGLRRRGVYRPARVYARLMVVAGPTTRVGAQRR